MRRPDRFDVSRGLLAAALVLAVTSRGDAAVLAAVLVMAGSEPAAGVAVIAALAASSWRWDTTALDALAGAQAVLGPAALVGPTAAAVGSWSAAVALVLALSSRAEVLRVAVAAAVAAAVLAGPAPGGEVWVRLVAAGVAGAVSFGVARGVERSPRLDDVRRVAAVVLGVGAMLAIAPDGPTWPPELDLGAAAEGLAVVLVITGLSLTATAVAGHPRWRSGWSGPRLRRAQPRRPGASSRFR